MNSLDHLDQAAVLDGIASTGLTPEYRSRTARIDLSDATAHARAALGPEHYDQAYQTGARMPHDQAVEYTLQVLDDLINEIDDTRAT